MEPMAVLFLLVIIILIVLVLVRKHNGSTEIQIAEIEAWFEKNMPITEPSEDYLRSAFSYRYHDSFVYHGQDRTRLYQVYPLCCEKCTRNAYEQFHKRQALAVESKLLAPLVTVARHATPPKDQGQAADDMTYVVFTIERLTPYPILRDLTRADLAQLMETLANPDWKINDISIANVGRHPTSRILMLQFADDISPAKVKPKNIFYNRYNIMKHIPASSFLSEQEHKVYTELLPMIKASKNHLHDVESFLNVLR